MRFGLSKYSKPTPAKMRQLGDGILAMSTFVTAFAIENDQKTLALVAVLVGSVGKFLTNFFAD